jgi:hypothetical protein
MLPAAKNQGLFNLNQANQVMMTGFPAPSLPSESIMRKCLVRLGHTMNFLAFLDRPTPAFGSFCQLARQSGAHGFFSSFTRGIT